MSSRTTSTTAAHRWTALAIGLAILLLAGLGGTQAARATTASQPGGQSSPRTAPRPNTAATTGSQTFNFTGSTATFTVPTFVSPVTIQALGASGGSNGGSGALGASVQGDFTVCSGGTCDLTPGETLTVLVGGQGTSGITGAGGGGGGGGGSFV